MTETSKARVDRAIAAMSDRQKSKLLDEHIGPVRPGRPTCLPFAGERCQGGARPRDRATAVAWGTRCRPPFRRALPSAAEPSPCSR